MVRMNEVDEPVSGRWWWVTTLVAVSTMIVAHGLFRVAVVPSLVLSAVVLLLGVAVGLLAHRTGRMGPRTTTARR